MHIVSQSHSVACPSQSLNFIFSPLYSGTVIYWCQCGLIAPSGMDPCHISGLASPTGHSPDNCCEENPSLSVPRSPRCFNPLELKQSPATVPILESPRHTLKSADLPSNTAFWDLELTVQLQAPECSGVPAVSPALKHTSPRAPPHGVSFVVHCLALSGSTHVKHSPNTHRF